MLDFDLVSVHSKENVSLVDSVSVDDMVEVSVFVREISLESVIVFDLSLVTLFFVKVAVSDKVFVAVGVLSCDSEGVSDIESL